MAVDLDRVRSWNSQTKFQRENPAAFQSLNALTQGQADVNSAIAAANKQIASLQESFTKVTIVEPDTSGAPQFVDLSTYQDFGLMIIKDIAGNASSNTITITGTVDATVNPVINTNYGFYHVYQSGDGNYYTW